MQKNGRIQWVEYTYKGAKSYLLIFSQKKRFSYIYIYISSDKDFLCEDMRRHGSRLYIIIYVILTFKLCHLYM